MTAVLFGSWGVSFAAVVGSSVMALSVRWVASGSAAEAARIAGLRLPIVLLMLLCGGSNRVGSSSGSSAGDSSAAGEDEGIGGSFRLPIVRLMPLDGTLCVVSVSSWLL